jgi:hypothetical protein
MPKEKAAGNQQAPSPDLDSGVAPLTGKRIFYQLTDAEGGRDEPDGRKSVALITRNLRGERDEEGRLVHNIVVFPGNGHPPFTKMRVPSDSGRTPGTWDNIQPGDLKN